MPRHNRRDARIHAQTQRRELPAQPPERLAGGGTLRGREPPEVLEESAGPTDDEGAATSNGASGGHEDTRRGGFRRALGIVLRVAQPPRDAEGGQRAHGTRGPGRAADRLAQVHERRGDVAGTVAIEERLGAEQDGRAMGGRARGSGDGEHARQDARDVRLRGGHAAPEGQRRHGGRDVVAEAGKGSEGLRVLRQAAAVPPDDLARRAMEIAGAGVVAQPRPLGEDALRSRPGERGHVREAGEERLVPRPHGLHRGLLEHDLGDPDAIGVANAAPGEAALLAIEPVEQPRG